MKERNTMDPINKSRCFLLVMLFIVSSQLIG
jgi:hypothetical protein